MSTDIAAVLPRATSIASNPAFVVYGTLAGLPPVVMLHRVLLPLNLLRLVQAWPAPMSRRPDRKESASCEPVEAEPGAVLADEVEYSAAVRARRQTPSAAKLLLEQHRATWWCRPNRMGTALPPGSEMRGDAAHFAGFSGVEATTRIHPHRAPGGHRPSQAMAGTERWLQDAKNQGIDAKSDLAGRYRSLQQALASLLA